MALNIHDFPLKIIDGCLLNNEQEIILDFNSSSKEDLISFIQETIPAINDGKRVYKKRLTKTFNNISVEEAIALTKAEMFSKGFVFYALNSPKLKLYDVEYTLIIKNETSIQVKLYFNKYIRKNMENKGDNQEEIKLHLKNVLSQIMDAKSAEEKTPENTEAAMKDLIQLLNLTLINIKEKYKTNLKGVFNQYQQIWYYCIKELNKEIKYAHLNINPNLFRCYILTVFQASYQSVLVKELTGWSPSMLLKEKITYDMKVLLLSVKNIIREQLEKDKQEKKD